LATDDAPSTPGEDDTWDGEVEALLLDQIDAAVIALDLDGNVTHWNAHAERIYGWSREEVLGRDVESIGLAAAGPGRKEAAMERLRSGRSSERDVEVLRKDGSSFLAFAKDAPLHSPSGRLIGYVGVSVDVTERREVEAAVGRRNAQLIRAKRVARLDSWEWDLEAGFLRVLGVEETASTSGGSFDELVVAHVHPGDRERVRETVARALAAGRDYAVEFEVQTPDGRPRHLLAIGEVETDADGKAVKVWGISQDVTDQREAQLALRASELARRRLLLQLLTVEDDERRRLAADIHDDAIQVLHAALLRAEALSAALTDPKQSAAAGRVEETLRSAVGNLRNIVAGVRQPAFDGVDLVPAIEAYLDETTADWPVGHHVEARIGREPLPEVRAVLFRIVVEAVANARKHSEARRLTVRVESDVGGVRVEVADDGRGFDEVAEGMREAGHYGLATMKERAELAGGWLKVHSTPGVGTTIESWVPHLSGDPSDVEQSGEQKRPGR
jgi:PAS domain S-box-containing protein